MAYLQWTVCNELTIFFYLDNKWWVIVIYPCFDLCLLLLYINNLEFAVDYLKFLHATGLLYFMNVGEN